MALELKQGGYELSAEYKKLLYAQRAITQKINNNFVQVGAVYLRPSGKNPFDESDWFKRGHRDTNLQEWIDEPEFLTYNLGFNLQLGWVDIDIDAEDPEFNRCIVAALSYLRIDTRFRFGRASVGEPTHILVQLGEDEASSWELLKRFEPKPFVIAHKRYHVQLRSTPTNISEKNVATTAMQTVMPGSIYSHKVSPDQPDISVWYADGRIATNYEHVAQTTPRKANFNELIRAICFGVFLYSVKDKWIEGARQIAATKISGWLARIAMDSAAMNNHEGIAKDVFCAIDSDEMAERLIEFVCHETNDNETNMRVRAYKDARRKLDHNPDAKVPGWPAMEQLIGTERTMALRAVFMPGSDVSRLTQMAERYIYDESDDRYIDRDRFFSASNYVHEGGQLERRHRSDTVRIGGKPREAFKLFEASDMRKRVGMRDLYPDLNPGGIYRITSQHRVLNDEDEDKSALAVFNTWRGWTVSPAAALTDEFRNTVLPMLDKVLGWLTRDNENQIEWVKDWIAWTIQNPGKKQQIAWVCVGDQGVGKSWIGNVFFSRLFGSLWGSASPKVLEGDFNIGPFKDKMFVFIDEAKFASDVGVDEIKKLIRSVDVPGMEKFQEARNYRIYARLMFASNRLDMNIGQSNVTDRALFYTRTYDSEFKGIPEREFREWAETLKPFFDEFTSLMEKQEIREQFMRFFMDRKVDRYTIESIKHSSSRDPAIVVSNMGWVRRVAKAIIEDGRIYEDLDISFPFTVPDLNVKVVTTAKDMGFGNVQGARVLAEFQHAGIVEPIIVGGQKKMRFTHKIATLHQLFGDAIGVPLEARFEFTKADEGLNDCDGSTRPPWRGAKKGVARF